MIGKHLIHVQESKEPRKCCEQSKVPGQASWISCLLLMSSSSHSLVFPYYQNFSSSLYRPDWCKSPFSGGKYEDSKFPLVVKCINQSKEPDKYPSIYIGGCSLNDFFFSFFFFFPNVKNLLVVSHGISDLHLRIDNYEKFQKQVENDLSIIL